MAEIKIDPEWAQLLNGEFEQPYFKQLTHDIKVEYQTQLIFPPGKLIFEAFNRTPPSKVKVVILGQDPYHGPGQANGMCFSVNSGVAFPPSLLNIFKELRTDLGQPLPTVGDLGPWADQGVFLLNSTLTVRAGQAASHQGKGWERFTDAVISTLAQQKTELVFLLWGRFAQNKSALIVPNRGHLVLKSAHPSPLSAHNGFFGCKHFSQANTHLTSLGHSPINWQLP